MAGIIQSLFWTENQMKYFTWEDLRGILLTYGVDKEDLETFSQNTKWALTLYVNHLKRQIANEIFREDIK